jgi:hypothetical protein
MPFMPGLLRAFARRSRHLRHFVVHRCQFDIPQLPELVKEPYKAKLKSIHERTLAFASWMADVDDDLLELWYDNDCQVDFLKCKPSSSLPLPPCQSILDELEKSDKSDAIAPSDGLCTSGSEALNAFQGAMNDLRGSMDTLRGAYHQPGDPHFRFPSTLSTFEIPACDFIKGHEVLNTLPRESITSLTIRQHKGRSNFSFMDYSIFPWLHTLVLVNIENYTQREGEFFKCIPRALVSLSVNPMPWVCNHHLAHLPPSLTFLELVGAIELEDECAMFFPLTLKEVNLAQSTAISREILCLLPHGFRTKDLTLRTPALIMEEGEIIAERFAEEFLSNPSLDLWEVGSLEGANDYLDLM